MKKFPGLKNIIMDCCSWCARRLQRAFSAGEPVYVQFPQSAAKLLDNTDNTDRASFWVSESSLPEHLVKDDDSPTTPQYLEEPQPPAQRVSFFSVSSSVVGFEVARSLRARASGARSESSLVGSPGNNWDGYYDRANQSLLEPSST